MEKEYYDDNEQRLKRCYQFKDGQLHGPYEEYDATGSLTIKANYQHDALDGNFRFYEKDHLLFEGQYENGQQQGLCKTYDPTTGKLTSELHYQQNVLEGEAKYYDGQGQLLRHCFYHQDQYHGDYIQYYPSGQIYTTAHYQNGELDGEKCTYYPNEKLQERATYEAGKPVSAIEKFDQAGQPINDSAATAETEDAAPAETKLDFFSMLGLIFKSFFTKNVPH